ncbi:unnamed protein product [Candidula unifasciata]|uniref:Thioredoxin domain-containing protein n=1 Tax=Candidula unifasciata TaxID=100452 RepID=A0A8S3ZZY2_9EUPU|nr:unnamed protein product [Candidula unifasciata]
MSKFKNLFRRHGDKDAKAPRPTISAPIISAPAGSAPFVSAPAVPAPFGPAFDAERVPDEQSKDPFFDSDYVFRLTSCNFTPFIQRKDIALVMFYGDESDHQAVWAKLQINMASEASKRENHGYAAVNCNTDSELCASERVCKTPMYKVYSRGNVLSSIQEISSLQASEIKMLVEKAPVLLTPRRAVPFS